MRYAVYEQRTGLFTLYEADGSEIAHEVGYAGRRNGKNNPAAQDLVGVGPLPVGRWSVRNPVHHPRLGPVAFPLDPRSDVRTRRSGFYIHGDSRLNPGQASHGCIILSRKMRDLIALHRPAWVAVVTGPHDHAHG